MARGVTRAPEIATRIALGGGRAVILRQLLTESVVLAALGGAAGIALGYAGSRVFASAARRRVRRRAGGPRPRRARARDHRRDRARHGLVFGLVPALQASRVNLRETLVESGSPSIAGASRSWPRRVLVVAEVALGVVLLVGAGLLIRTVRWPDAAARRVRSDARDDGDVVAPGRPLSGAGEGAPVPRRHHRAHARDRPASTTLPRALTLPFERALNIGGRWVGVEPRRERDTNHEPDRTSRRATSTRCGSRSSADACSPTAMVPMRRPVIVVNQAFVARYRRARIQSAGRFSRAAPRAPSSASSATFSRKPAGGISVRSPRCPRPTFPRRRPTRRS